VTLLSENVGLIVRILSGGNGGWQMCKTRAMILPKVDVVLSIIFKINVYEYIIIIQIISAILIVTNHPHQLRQYHSSCFAHLQSTIFTREQRGPDSNNKLHSNIFDIHFNVTKSQTENHILTANTIVSRVILSLPTAIKGIKRQSEER